ncbi:MAG: tetratricopeptide repeat protein [Acidobacteriota bacterium]
MRSLLDRQELRLPAAILFIASVALFWSSRNHDFVYDDTDIIAENPLVLGEQPVEQVFRTPYWGPHDNRAHLYRPLTILAFRAERAVFGEGPGPVHLVNILLNGLLSVLTFVFVLRLGVRMEVAALTGLLMGIHPLHVEVVGNGVGQAELFASVLALLAGLVHLEWLRGELGRDLADHDAPITPGVGALSHRIVSIALYGLAMGFKESAVVLPGLLFLIEWILVHRLDPMAALRRANRYLAYALALLPFLLLRFAVVGGTGPGMQEVMGDTSRFQQVLHGSEILLRVLVQLLVPRTICADYTDYRQPIAPSLADPVVLLSLIAWPLLIVGATLLARRGRPWFLVGLSWYLLAMLPVSHLLFPIGTVRADRLAFTPSLGILLALAFGLDWLRERDSRMASGLTLLFVAGFALRTVIALPAWENRESLWTSVIKVNPGSPTAWLNIGETHRERGELTRAEACYRKALELRQGLGSSFPEAQTKLASLLAERGDTESGEQVYREALESTPEHFVALLNLGEMLLKDPETREEAIATLERAAAVSPTDFRPHANLSECYRLLGRPAEGLAAIDQAIALEPELPDLRFVRAEFLDRLGRRDEATAARNEANAMRGR